MKALVVCEKRDPRIDAAIKVVLDSVNSDNSRLAYGRALEAFLKWLTENRKPFNKAAVNEYKAMLVKGGASASTVNVKLSAIKKLAGEAADNKLLDRDNAFAIAKVAGLPIRGRRTGNWLQQNDAEILMNSIKADTFKGVRDRAVIGVLLGCGLRRAEIVALKWNQLVERDKRPVFCDVVGKGEKLRTVPVPEWTKTLLDDLKELMHVWALNSAKSEFVKKTAEQLHPPDDYIFRPLRKGASYYYGWRDIPEGPMTTQAIYNIVREYADAAKLNVSPHDLRRTFSKLAYRGKADLKQIQLTLGHASMETTERYLGEVQDLTNAPCDRVGIKVEPASYMDQVRKR